MKINRNQPCPCGSGKKYKHCCINGAAKVSDELETAMQGQEFNSLEQLQAFTNAFMQQRNTRPNADFHDLSSEQMHMLLHFSFDRPDLFQFSQNLTPAPDVPIMALIHTLAEAIDEKGLKATAKGNLPANLVRHAYEVYKPYNSADDFLYYRLVNKEDDFEALHAARVLLEVSGLLRKTKGRFYLTKKYQTLVNKKGTGGVYMELLQTYCTKFNWAYRDRMSDMPFIRQSFLFTLFLLAKYGDKVKPASFYTEHFLRAFPMVVFEAEEDQYSSAEDQVKHCYEWRCLNRFVQFFGLGEITVKDIKQPRAEVNIQKTPLLNQVVTFMV